MSSKLFIYSLTRTPDTILKNVYIYCNTIIFITTVFLALVGVTSNLCLTYFLIKKHTNNSHNSVNLKKISKNLTYRFPL